MDYNDSYSNFSEDLRSPSSSVENDGSNDKPQFLESLKMIESFAELLVCVICGKLPQEKVYTLGRCFHKYCENCVKDYAGKPCVVCGEKGYPKDAKQDFFSTSILLEIPKVYKVLKEMQEMSSAGSTGEKRKPLRTSTPKLQDSDEEMEEDNQNEPEDDDQIVANEAEIEFDPGASEKARDNLHLNAITFSTLDGNDAENDGDQNEEPVAHKRNELQKEVPPVVAYDVYEFNECTPSSGTNKKQNASPDVLEETPQNKPRSHRLEGRSSSRKTFSKDIKGVRCLDFPMDVPAKNNNERATVVDAGLEKRKKEAEMPSKTNLGKSKINTPLKTPDEEPIFSDEELFKSQRSCQGDGNEAGLGVQVADVPILTPHIPTVQSEQPKQSTNTLGKKRTSKSDRSSGEQEPPTLTPYITTEKGTRSDEAKKKTGNKVKMQPKRSRRKSSPIASAIPDWLSKSKSTRRKGKPADYDYLDDDDSPDFKSSTKILPSVKVRSRRSSASSVTKVALLSPLSTSSTSLSDSFSSSKRGKEKRNPKGETQLHIACRAGQVDRVKGLVEDGYDVDAKDNAGWKPLHEVVNSKKTSKEDIIALIRILHEKGCNMNAVGGPEQETVLHLAVQNGIEEIVATLLDLGASPNIRNESKQLPRDLAYNEVIINMLDEKAGKLNGGGENAANTSNDGSTTSHYDSALTNVGDDPAVLQVMLEKAVIYFNFEVSKEDVQKTKTLLKLKVFSEFPPNVTHIVHDVNEKKNGHFYVPLTFEYLYGLAKGRWQVSYGWIQDSIKSSKCLSPKPFEIGGYYRNTNPDSLVFGAPMKSRVNHDNGNPGLLDGFEFYLYKSCGYSNGNLDLNKKDLVDLITAAGGKVTNREPNPNQISPLDYPSRYHVSQDSSSPSMKLMLTTHIILYDDKAVPSKKYTMEHVKTLKSDWLIESLANFQLEDPDCFL